MRGCDLERQLRRETRFSSHVVAGGHVSTPRPIRSKCGEKQNTCTPPPHTPARTHKRDPTPTHKQVTKTEEKPNFVPRAIVQFYIHKFGDAECIDHSLKTATQGGGRVCCTRVPVKLSRIPRPSGRVWTKIFSGGVSKCERRRI